MKTRTVTHGEIEITLSEATTLIGMKRSRMKVEASQATFGDQDRQILALVTYPDLLAPVVELKGMEAPTFEQFLELPEALVIPWEQAVYELNPHWLPGNQEKKE